MMRITSRLSEKDHMLDLAIYNANKEIAEIGEKKRNEAFYGYSCIEDQDKRLKLLCTMLPLFESEREILALGGECLTIEEAECLIGKHVVLFEEGARVDLERDTSNLDLWIALNPNSVARQKWEEAACNVACEYELVLVADPVECEYELKSSADTLDCEIVADFVAAHKACSYEMDFNSFQEQCEYEFDILRKDKACEIGFEMYLKENACELDLDQYVCLRNCDLDLNIIRTVLAAGCTINVGEL